ncbi:MAG: hypothetical protein RR049_02940 [Angelakisella sp.]
MALLKMMNYLTNNKLEKAKIYKVQANSLLKDTFALGQPIEVQFNPSEYQITRSMHIGKKNAVGRDPNVQSMQAISGELATLTVSLYFDTNTKYRLTGALGSVLGLFSKDPPESGQEIATLLRYDSSEHAPLKIRFVWGDMDFVGFVCNSTIAYTMFSKGGKPLRAKVDLTIYGEETQMLRGSMQMPFESPNRTKERVLTEGDQLWMMAQQEYDNPALWKPIAAANGILNPRKLGGITSLKVPSIK